jgi:hypothetical protein
MNCFFLRQKIKPMKKLLLLLMISASTLLACSSIEKDARAKIEQHIKENAHDAKSYEFVNMEKPDTLFVADTLLQSIKADSEKILDFAKTEKLYKEQADFYAAEMQKDTRLTSVYKETYDRCLSGIVQFQERAKEVELIIEAKKSAISDLKNKPMTDQIIKVNYRLNFRIKNLMGGFTRHTPL